MGESRDYSMSEAALAQRQQAPVKHFVHSFEKRGEAALDPQKINRLAELRKIVADEPGRRHLRLELTARMALICELGFVHLRERANSGEDIWSGGLIRRLATYVAETRRLLDSFPEENPSPVTITDLIKGDGEIEQT